MGRPDMSLYIFVDKILKNKSISMFNYGKHSRDFTYIDDIVEGISKTLNKIPKKILGGALVLTITLLVKHHFKF